jgi:hypothetical protein
MPKYLDLMTSESIILKEETDMEIGLNLWILRDLNCQNKDPSLRLKVVKIKILEDLVCQKFRMAEKISKAQCQ